MPQFTQRRKSPQAFSDEHEYGPFGEVIRATGSMAKANPSRFSTKYQDDETDLLYYGYRYYGYRYSNQSTGRWLSRDPAGEGGGPSLYTLAGNVMGVDPLGLAELHYISYPKWQEVDFQNVNDPHSAEFLWVGHDLTFTPGDAAKLSGGTGFMIENERSEAAITDCQSLKTVHPKSDNLFFANRFTLDSAGRVTTQSDPDRFDDGEVHLFTQMDSFSMSALYRKWSHSSFGREVATKGWIHTRLEIHVIAQNAYDLGTEPWIPQRTWEQVPGSSSDNINGHQLGRRRWGRMENQTPMSRMAGTIYSQTIDVSFSWDDCATVCGGGRVTWDYRVSPRLTSQGSDRVRYSRQSWGPHINLLRQPSN
jgi:RHS repeat-associated protein